MTELYLVGGLKLSSKPVWPWISTAGPATAGGWRGLEALGALRSPGGCDTHETAV